MLFILLYIYCRYCIKINKFFVQYCVAPLVGAWIEILRFKTANKKIAVAPLVGAWIEIYAHKRRCRENIVAPLVGAWIEIFCQSAAISKKKVAPLVGAWIEISSSFLNSAHRGSLLSWERGLKYLLQLVKQNRYSRSSRGSVD